jgi:DNA helicase-2/ATP-dependent DNA helicase PcrA
VVDLGRSFYQQVTPLSSLRHTPEMSIARIDYADMVSLPIQLLKENKSDIRKKVMTKIKHLLVDELQDITMKEAQFICYVAEQAESSVLVGDKKQSIYGFRGSDLKCWKKLEQKLNPTFYYLTESFRVPRSMLPLVNAIGSDIVGDDPKLTSSKKGFKPRLFRSSNNDEQSDFIVREIKQLLAKGVPAEEIAILGRTTKPLILFKNTLTMSGIEAKEAYRKSDAKPEKALKSLIRITKWQAKVSKKGKHLFKLVNALTRILKISGLPSKIQDKLINQVHADGLDGLCIPKKQGEKYYRRILALRKAVKEAASLPPETGGQYLIDALKPIMGSKFGKKEKTIITRDFSTIKLAMRAYKTWDDVDVNSLPTIYSKSKSCVELTTCHGAKGKEWQYVFLIHVVDGEFPCISHQKSAKLGEELRLFYVAVSRASKMLTIVESPVQKRKYFNRKTMCINLQSESTFIKRYESELKLINR